MFSSSKPPPPDSLAVVSLIGAPTLNPDLNGRPSPAVVRVYQLTSTEMLANADFFQAFEQEKAALGPTMLGKEEVILQPGGIETVSLGLLKTAKVVAVVVGYRKFEKATWWASAPVVQNQTTTLRAEVMSNVVTMKAGNGAPSSALPSPNPSAEAGVSRL